MTEPARTSRRRDTVPINPDTLREMRKLAGLKAIELAKMAGINPSYVSLLESGSREPSPAVVKRIADALGVTVASLFSRPSESSASEVQVG